MRLTLLAVVVCLSVAVHADQQGDARDRFEVATSTLRMLGGALPDGTRVAADLMQGKRLSGNAEGLEISFRGHVTITKNGVTVMADEATYNPTTHELVLTGNVRMVVTDVAPSAK